MIKGHYYWSPIENEGHDKESMDASVVDRCMMTRPNPLRILSVCEQCGVRSRTLAHLFMILHPFSYVQPNPGTDRLAFTARQPSLRTELDNMPEPDFLPSPSSLCQSPCPDLFDCVYRIRGHCSFCSASWEDQFSFCLGFVDE